MLGGHYTYAQVPLGFWIQEAFGFSPEPLRPDRALRAGVHSGDAGARDLHPALAAARGAGGCRSWSICFCLAFSAFYELIEFWTALAAGGAADGFPGHPGRRVGHAVGHAAGADRGDRRRWCCCRGCRTGSWRRWASRRAGVILSPSLPLGTAPRRIVPQDDNPLEASTSMVVDSPLMTASLRVRAGFLAAGALSLVVSLGGCQDADTAGRRADSLAAASPAAAQADTTPAASSWIMRPIVVAPDPARRPQAGPGDSAGPGASGETRTLPTRRAPTRLASTRPVPAAVAPTRPSPPTPGGPRSGSRRANAAAMRSRRPTRRAGRSRAPRRHPARSCPST